MMRKDSHAENPSARLPTAGIPPSSLASLHVRNALSEEMGWRSGRLIPGGRGDAPFCPVYGEAYGEIPAPEWIIDGIRRIDGALPAPSVILAALSPIDQVLTANPAVGRMPRHPDPAAAANCLLAGRILLAIRSMLVVPVFLDHAIEIAKLNDASLLAATVGGPRVIEIAVGTARLPSTFVRNDAAPFLFDDVEVV